MVELAKRKSGPKHSLFGLQQRCGDLERELKAILSRCEYVFQHRFGANDPVGTRLVSINDLKSECERARELLKCKTCKRDMPDNPCAIVEAVKLGTKVEVNISINGKRLVHFGPAEYPAIEQWCHEWAEDNRTNLHWHWAL